MPGRILAHPGKLTGKRQIHTMIIRKEENGALLISQPAHAWVSGQIARQWGNDSFPPVCEEVRLAAELHDIGFLPWDTSPELNPETGLPYTFLEMPGARHLEVWNEGITRMRRYGRYPALLVSRHFTEIARRARPSKGPQDQSLLDRFLAEQEEVQSALLTSLQNDHYYAPRASAESVARDQQFVSMADWISLQLCLACNESRIAVIHPANGQGFELMASPINPFESSMRPWPFRAESLQFMCEGRRLLSTFSDETRMREALQAAAPVTLIFRLKPLA